MVRKVRSLLFLFCNCTQGRSSKAATDSSPLIFTLTSSSTEHGAFVVHVSATRGDSQQPETDRHIVGLFSTGRFKAFCDQTSHHLGS